MFLLVIFVIFYDILVILLLFGWTPCRSPCASTCQPRTIFFRPPYRLSCRPTYRPPYATTCQPRTLFLSVAMSATMPVTLLATKLDCCKLYSESQKYDQPTNGLTWVLLETLACLKIDLLLSPKGGKNWVEHQHKRRRRRWRWRREGGRRRPILCSAHYTLALINIFSEKSKDVYNTVSDILTQCQNELRNWQTHENESGKMVSEKLKWA